MIDFLATLAGIALCLGLLLYLFKDQQKLGRTIEREAQERKALEDAKQVIEIHDRLKHDSAFSSVVRKRFTRDQ